MSFELVDAVNQQCELEKGATDLLILTKFAEMVADPKNPVRRVGLDRFMAITRLDRRTIQRHLHGLHDSGLLVCLDGDKVKGDRPKLYRLVLPEGFDSETVKRRRLKFYGGRPFSSIFNEDNSSLQDVTLTLPPVKLSEVQDKLPQIQDRLSGIQDSLPPYNITIKENNNNNKPGGVVVDDEVDFVLKSAARATGGKRESFLDLGITSANAKTALDAVRYFEALRENDESAVKTNPVLYLKKVMKSAIETNGANLEPGSLEPPEGRDPRKAYVQDTWIDFVFADHKLKTLGKEKCNEIFMKISHTLPLNLSLSELRRRLESGIARFEEANPVTPTDPDTLSAAILEAFLADDSQLTTHNS